MAMYSVVSVWKPIGLTPFQAVLAFKKENIKYKDTTISYAGRLDPMAEGVLLLLVGDENKKRREYEKLTKTYEAEIVLGIATDSYDALGIVKSLIKVVSVDGIDKSLWEFRGKHFQQFPHYSSKVVGGKPLFWWARQGRLSEIEIPGHQIEIYSIGLKKTYVVDVEKMYLSILEKIEKVDGNFRQKEIVKAWNKFYQKNKEEKVHVLKIKLTCSSGTYIRQLAFDLGKKLQCGAFALSIKRTQIGRYGKKECIYFASP